MKLKLFTSNTYFDSFGTMLANFVEHFDKNSKYIFVVPSKYSLTVEKQIIESLNLDCYVNVEVTTINSLANALLDFDSSKFLNKNSSILLISKLANQYKKELQVFSNAVDKSGFCESVYGTINQLKSCQISSNEFASFLTSQNILDKKVKDISFIYTKYDEYLSENLLDSNTRFDIFIEKLATSEFFADKNVFFGLFDSFTSQLYTIVSSIIQKSKSASISTIFCNDSQNSFVFENKIYQNIIQLAKKRNIEIEHIKTKAKLPKAQNHILQNLFTPNYSKVSINNEIGLFYSSTSAKEIEWLAEHIKNKIINENLRYSNFAVLSCDLPSYSGVIKSVFDSYDIPYYLDEKHCLTEYVLSKFVFDFINVVQSNYDSASVLNFCHNYFCNLNSDELSNFDNLVTLYAINKSSFTNFVCKNQSNQNIFDNVYSKVIQKIVPLVKKFKSSKQITEKLFVIVQLVEIFDCKSKLDLLNQNLISSGDSLQAKINSIALDKFYDSIALIEQIIGNSELDDKVFVSLLSNLFASTKYSSVPQGVDEIFVGDFANGMASKVKYLYVVGASSNCLPCSKNDCGLLTDHDIKSLNKQNLINPLVSELNHLSTFNSFQTLLMFENELNISYALKTASGNSLVASSISKNLSKIFTNSKNTDLPFVNVDNRLTYISMLSDAKKSEGFASYFAHKSTISKKYLNTDADYKTGNSAVGYKYINSLKKFLQDNNIYIKQDLQINHQNLNTSLTGKSISITKCETFYKCPYLNFVQNSLNIKSQAKNQLETFDVGIILHSIAEEFTKQYKNNSNINPKSVATKLFERELLKYEYFVNNTKNKIIIKLLQSEALSLCDDLAKIFENTNCEKTPEYQFAYPLKNIIPSLNADIVLNGKIDRIDAFDNHISIIDYKSGNSSFKYSDVFTGTRLQLPIYSLVAEKIFNKKIAGAFYYGIKNNLTQKDVSEKSYDGFLLNNLATMKSMDKTIEDNMGSKLLTVTLAQKDNQIACKKTSKVLDEEEIKILCDYSAMMVQKAIDNLQKGVILTSPNQESCKHCKYSGICKFFASQNISYRRQTTATKFETIKEALNNEN